MILSWDTCLTPFPPPVKGIHVVDVEGPKGRISPVFFRISPYPALCAWPPLSSWVWRKELAELVPSLCSPDLEAVKEELRGIPIARCSANPPDPQARLREGHPGPA